MFRTAGICRQVIPAEPGNLVQAGDPENPGSRQEW